MLLIMIDDILGIYTQGDMENIYTSLHDPDRTKSNANPNVYFYKTDSYHHPGLIY